MKLKARHILSLIFLICTHLSNAQQQSVDFKFDFRVNHTDIDLRLGRNTMRMQEMCDFLHNLRNDSTLSIISVTYYGAASPEGNATINRKLAQSRIAAIRNAVDRHIYIPDSLISSNDSYIPWETLYELVAESDISHRDTILTILREPQIEHRIATLRNLNNGDIWRQLNQLFFPRMRNAGAVFITYRKAPLPKSEPKLEPQSKADTIPATKILAIAKPIENPAQKTIATPDTLTAALVDTPRRFLLKTNALGWGIAIANIAAEIDFAPHWSATLPIYWSAWNYFKSTLKFRTLTFQPEVRYWFSNSGNGWFAGAHLGLAWYNFATDGTYRTQDHDRHTPAYGGGISAGYRLPVGQRWLMEFSLGAGIYALHYDKFRNEPNGLLVRTDKKTYFGIDQAAVTIAYTFDLNK